MLAIVNSLHVFILLCIVILLADSKVTEKLTEKTGEFPDGSLLVEKPISDANKMNKIGMSDVKTNFKKNDPKNDIKQLSGDAPLSTEKSNTTKAGESELKIEELDSKLNQNMLTVERKDDESNASTVNEKKLSRNDADSKFKPTGSKIEPLDNSVRNKGFAPLLKQVPQQPELFLSKDKAVTNGIDHDLIKTSINEEIPEGKEVQLTALGGQKLNAQETSSSAKAINSADKPLTNDMPNKLRTNSQFDEIRDSASGHSTLDLAQTAKTKVSGVTLDSAVEVKSTPNGAKSTTKTGLPNDTLNEIKKHGSPGTSKKSDPVQGEEDDFIGYRNGKILLITLGGGEDEIFTANAAHLLSLNGHEVSVLAYGTTREVVFPDNVEVIEIPVTRADPLQSEGGVSGSDGVGVHEWATGSIVWSRVAACAGLAAVESKVSALQASVIITPLWLHDVCTLALAKRLSVPAIGVITSRVGAWWAWTQLGALPDLASASAPTGGVGENGFSDRAANIAQHYSFISSIRQRWQVAAMSALPSHWEQTSLTDLYEGLHRVLVCWDPLLHPSPPHTPSVISVGGFPDELTRMTKDVLVPALLNKAGVIVVSPGTREVWIGVSLIETIYRTLGSLSYTVLWGVPHHHLKPNVSVDETNSTKEQKVENKFVFKENLPLNAVLSHPRHRLLISTCSESELMSAAHFASPILCLPVTTDQLLAAQHLKMLGVGDYLPAWEASESQFIEVLKAMLNDRKFRQKARGLAEELHDLPVSPSDTFLYHVGHVLRRPNSLRFGIHGSKLSLLQQSNADVFLALILLLVVVIGIVMAALVMFGPILLMKMKHKKD